MGGGSSSSAWKEVEEFETTPHVMDRSSKSKLSEPKKVIYHEIVEVDMEEDSDYGSLMDSEVDGSAKEKEILLNSLVGDSGLADKEYGDVIPAFDDDSAELEDSDIDADMEDEDDDTYYDDVFMDENDYLESHFDNMELPPGVEAPVPWLPGSPKNDGTVTASTSYNAVRNSLRGGMKKVVDEVVEKFEKFAKFDTVEDFSDHHYSKRACAAKLASKNWPKKIQEEWKILEKNLPAEIYVRAYESRMDLLRAVIIGAQGTPYHDGLFFFDVYFPSSYPDIPPEVHYHSGGLRINPNLYNSGKVCLSLLNTWTGRGKEKWIPGESTILQVLVSIQALILNAEPYFNEPGYEREKGTTKGEKNSLAYNETTFMYSLKTMMYSMQKPPKHFEDFVVGYFRKNARYILVSCVACLNGAPLGGLVPDKEDMSCSNNLRRDIGEFITRLAQKFTDIGADGCQDFLAEAKTVKIASPP